MEFLPTYIMRGRVQAITVASAFALLSIIFPPVSIVSSASVALVTLRRGATEGGYILICACLASALLGFFLIGSYQFPLAYGLTLWTPIWLISVVLREGRHLFLAIEIVIVIAAIAVLGAYLYQPDLAQFWQTLLDPMLKAALANSDSGISTADITHSLSVFYHFVITGLVALIYVSGVLAGLFLGRGWQAVLYNPGGFKKEYLALRGQSELAIATLAIIGAGLLFSGQVAEICWNISILLFVLYALIGTTILHCAFATLKQKRFLLPFLYITMMIVPHALIPAAILGLADTWLNLRNKIPNQTSV
jgi:hypothetical protein